MFALFPGISLDAKLALVGLAVSASASAWLAYKLARSAAAKLRDDRLPRDALGVSYGGVFEYAIPPAKPSWPLRFSKRLWGRVPGDSFVAKLTFVSTVLALLPVLWGVYNWTLGRDIETVGPRIEQQQRAQGEDIRAQGEDIREIKRLVQEKAAGSEGHRSSPPSLGEGLNTDISAGIQTLLDAGREEALRDKTGEAAQAALDGLIVKHKAAQDQIMKEEAALWRQKGAFAFLEKTEAAIGAYLRAVELDPDDPEGWYLLGELQMRGGPLPAAKQSFERVLALRTSIPDPRFVYWAYMLLGDAEAALGNRPPALFQYERARDLIKALAERDPANAEWQRDLSVSYGRIGKIQATRGDRDGALASYQESLRIQKTLAEQDPANAGWQRDLSVSYGRIGDIQAERSDRDGALASYQDSLRIQKALAERDPATAQWQRDLSVSFGRIGNIQAMRDRDGALASYQDSLRILKALVERDPGNADWQRDLSVSYTNIGDIQAARGDRDGALASYQDSLRIRKALAERDPANADWQRDLSCSYANIGGIQATRDRDGALASYQNSLRIRKALAERDPSNAGLQTDLVFSAWRLVIIGAQDACTHLRNGLRNLRRLDGENRLTAQQKGWMPLIALTIASQCG